MKLLCLGCLHGKVTRKLIANIKKENFDYVLCTGDLANGDKSRKLIFKYWDVLTSFSDLEMLIGKNRIDKIVKAEIKSMRPSITFLNSIKKRIFMVYGNNDYLREHVKGKRMKALEDRIKRSNVKLIKTGKSKINEYSLVGDSGLRCYNPKKLKMAFAKSKPPMIFMTHAPAYGYFDRVKLKMSPKYGEHVGEKHYLEAIKKYKPILHISSHMHEHQGKKKLGKTWIVNTGAAYLGRYAIVEIIDDKVKRVKFGR